MTNTKIKIISESEEFESLSEVWDSLLRKSKDDNPIYLTHEWLSIWWKHFGEGKKLNILLIEKEGQLIGIVPLMRTEYRIGLLRISALETIGSLNCNHIGLIRSGSSEEAVSAFLTYLEEEFTKGELVLRLAWVPDDSRFLDLLRSRISLPTSNLIMQEKVKTLAPYITLPSTWDEYSRWLSPNRRHVLRRKLRSLEKGWLHFSCLFVDSETVSAEFGFIYNHKFYCATSARDVGYSEYSVGHLHQMFLIKHAIEKGLREFDFLRGVEPYKFHWTKSARKYMNVIIVKKGLCSGLRLKLISAFLRFHEIKQYSLKEIHYLYLMKRREAKQRKEMGVGTLV